MALGDSIDADTALREFRTDELPEEPPLSASRIQFKNVGP